MEGTAGALATMLSTHPDAWVGAIGPDARYLPIPPSVPIRPTHRRLQGRWALDHVAAGDRAPLSEVWRRLIRAGAGHDQLRVRLAAGGSAEFHLFKVAEEHGVDVVVALADPGVDLGSPPIVQDLVTSSRFTRVLRDEAGRPLDIDGSAPEVLGWTAEELLGGTPPLERVHAEDRDRTLEDWMAMLAAPATGHRTRLRLLRRDGTYRWFEVTTFNRLDDPHHPCVVSEFLDISEEMAAHEAVRAREQLLHRLAEALPLGVLQVDGAGVIVYKNDFLGTLVGAPAASTMAEQFAAAAPDDRVRLQRAMDAALATGDDDEVVVCLPSPASGVERIVRVVTKALRDDSGAASGVIACVSDVTETERRATVDALTGCLNRATVLGRLEDALTSADRGTAAIFVDLDGFKEVNDRCGHTVGDEVLKAVARVLESTTRHGDSVGRFGGDEFLVVCTDVATEREGLDLAERLREAIRRHPTVRGADAPVRASIGVAWARRGTGTADELIERSDAAMYASKRSNAGRAHLWLDESPADLRA